MDFKLNEEQHELYTRALKFSKDHIVPNAIKYNNAHDIPLELCQKAYDAGLMNAHVPKYLGGQELGLLEETLIFEAIGYGDAGCATSINVNNLAFAPLLIGGNSKQLEKYLKPIVENPKVKFGAFCLTEREAGSDAGATKTMAVKEGDGWTINGTKCWITNAPQADLFTVFVQTQPGTGYKGMAVFMVPKNDHVKIGHIENKVGQLASVQSEVIFEDCWVPDDCLIGEVGKGFHIAMMTLDKTRTGIASIAVGVCQRALDEASKFAITRKAFGKKIMSFQGISFMIAEMAARAEAARLLTRKAAWMVDNEINASLDSAIAKWKASDWAMANATDAIQVMGGYGYAEEFGMGCLFDGAKLLQIYEGTNQVQRIVVANAIKKRAQKLDTGFVLNYEGTDYPDHTWKPE